MSRSTSAPIPGFTSNLAVVDGVTIHHWVGGDPEGVPVLLWHGFLGTGYAWRKVAPTLAEAGLAVLVPDMRGYGDSDKPDGDAGYDGIALAEEFRALVRKIEFGHGKPLTLVAHDMGAPPALLWAAAHPREIAGLIYLEEPTLLEEFIVGASGFGPATAGTGGTWWWGLAIAPGAPEALVVGAEREFLNWFFVHNSGSHAAVEPEAIDEYLRTFSGLKGVLGAMGVYRAAITTMAQTEPLTRDKVTVRIVALGGEKSMGAQVGEMISKVAIDVEGGIVVGSGHFLPEEASEEIVRRVLVMTT